MALKLKLELNESFELPCGFEDAYDFFMDVNKTSACFPKVESVKDLGDNKYHSVMEKEGVGKYTIQVEYAAQYSYNRPEGIITWKPVEGIGNGQNQGKAVLTDKGDTTDVTFSTAMSLNLPLPGLAKPIVKPFVNAQFKKTMQEFKANVIKELS